MTDRIQPSVERWRSGLDALLVFDKVARTNELLVNLTDIVVALGGRPASELNVTSPTQFRPDSSNVRVNGLWSLSLTLSLAIAALAVGCRAFTNMIDWSRHKKAYERLADIWTRWNAKNRLLRPAIESLPWLLIFPVLLFLIGILDMLISSVETLAFLPPFLVAALGLSVLSVTAVAALFCFIIVDGSIHPASSPFQSTFARTIHTSLAPRFERLRLVFSHGLAHSIKRETDMSQPFEEGTSATSLPPDTIDLYHKIVQLTHEDESLNQAAGALFNIINNGAGSLYGDEVYISSQECATLRHLLSPEASIRCNRTAASVIVRIQTVEPHRSIAYPGGEFGPILVALTEAAKRAGAGYTLAALWDSPFIRTIAVMLFEEDIDSTEHPLILRCLSSKLSQWHRLLFSHPECAGHHQSVLSFLLDVLYAKLHETLPAVANKVDARAVDLLLSPRFTLAAVPVSISTRNFMQSLIYRFPWEHQHELAHIIRWIMKATAPLHVVSCYLRNVDGLSPEQAESLSWVLCGNLFAIVDTVAQVCLDTEDFEDWALLAELCSTCLVKFITSRDRLGIVGFPFDLASTFLRVARNASLNPESPTFRHLSTIYRFVHDTPHLRYTELLTEFQAFLDIVEGKLSTEQDATYEDLYSTVYESRYTAANNYV
ncbi:hypothetical protein GGX14DRAFT_456567 [Mycena pura]|uniref:DUF6535 domain-containing protein n=1 Tax=Mycena pura TaxID=153505 RepID=A0AAD6YDI0_9AGAR|nr:hypothetical protein GGX14DRAFT_456567 [Mycena pura]